VLLGQVDGVWVLANATAPWEGNRTRLVAAAMYKEKKGKLLRRLVEYNPE